MNNVKKSLMFRYLMVLTICSTIGLQTWRTLFNNFAVEVVKMILRKKYWLYYFLTFMAGARRQIFMAFAIYLMVKKFQFSVQEIAILFVINNVVNYFLSPLIGKGIIRFGERKILSLEYFSLIFIFSAYAVVQSKFLAAVQKINTNPLSEFSREDTRRDAKKRNDRSHPNEKFLRGGPGKKERS